MKSSSAVLLATAGVAVAQNATLMTGPGPYPAEEAEIFQDANQEASKSVPFSLWYPSESENPAPTWTWTVSVNQGSVPDSEVPNAAQLNTEYQFAWGEGDLQQAVSQYPGNLDQNNFCVTVVESLFPRGVLNNYDEDTEENASDGSCEGPLREHCMREILNALQDAERDESGCRAGTVDLAGIHQCQWSFEGEFQASTYNLLSNATADQAANETFPLSSGTGFAHITSETFDGENRTFFNQQNTRLQMVIVDSGNTIETLCMRINTENTAGSIQGSAVTAGVNFWLIGATGIAALAYLL